MLKYLWNEEYYSLVGSMVFYTGISVKGLDLVVRFPWKVGLVMFMAFPDAKTADDINEALKCIVADSFFDEVEIPVYSKDIWDKIEPTLKERDLIVAGALQPDILGKGINLNSSTDEERKKAVEFIKGKIDLATEMGIKTIALCSGPDPGPDKREKERALLIESLMEICDYAKDKDVKVFLEPFDRDYDKKLLVGPLKEAVEIVAEVKKKHDNIAILWDLSHAPMLREKPEDLKSYKDYIGHIHVGCAKREGDTLKDTHPVFYTPGAINDVNDVARLFKTLMETDYRGIVTLEIEPEPQQTSLGIINTAKGVFLLAHEILSRGLLLS